MNEELAETSLDDAVTSPEVEVSDADEVEVEGNAEYDGEEDSEEQPNALDDSEELDFNGQTHKLPKTIAEAVRSMQKDYTVKTQAVAEQRKAFEAEVQFRQQNMQEIAKVTAMDDRISEYKNLDWQKISVEDPALFNQLRFQYDELKEARNNLAGQLSQKQQAETLQKTQEIAKQMQESDAVLRREIKDWSNDKETSLQDFAVKQYGFNLEDVKQAKANPALYKLLNDAYIGQSLLKKQANKPILASKKVEPVPIVSGRGSKASINPANMTDKQYMEWRQKGYK